MALKSTKVYTDMLRNSTKNIDDSIRRLSTANTYFSKSTMFELNPYWDGAAKQSFENKFMMFIENFEKLVNSFESLNDKLKETMKTYDTADNDVTSAIGKLGG